MPATSLDQIVSFCKRKGFIYPGSEIYNGFANSYSYGPYGAQLKKNIKDLWWKTFVQTRRDMVGLDGPILLSPKVWRASGHVDGFADQLVDCKQCKARLRADHLVEAATGEDCEGLPDARVGEIIAENNIKCPKCGKRDFTAVRQFNLMFETQLSKTGDDGAAYLRPETAQAIFVDFKSVTQSNRVRVPFGIAQIGKAFRNEITPGNFIFRLLEFEQMEIEYFIHPDDWQELFEQWLGQMDEWCMRIGLDPQKCHHLEHADEKLSHYSQRTVDIEYDFPFGRKELYGLAYRGDFDLTQHQKHSGKNLEYRDPQTNEKYLPHVLEPTFGLDRSILAVLCDAYCEEQLDDGSQRTVLRIAPAIAPVKFAVLPLMKKGGLSEKAQEIFATLSAQFVGEYDEAGAIGKRYRRQDEVGTPLCITVDFDTLEDSTVTVRERDSMAQRRVKIDELAEIVAQCSK